MQAFPLFEPPGMPLAGMRTSPAPLVLGPGEQALIQNMRWGETNSPSSRNGVTEYLVAPTAATGTLISIIDIWAGELNAANPTQANIYVQASVWTTNSTHIAVSGFTAGTPGELTAIGHGLTTGQWVVLNNFLGPVVTDGLNNTVNGSPSTGIEGLFQITVVDVNHFTLNGSTIAVGTYPGAGYVQTVEVRIFASISGAALTEITGEGVASYFGENSLASTRFPNVTQRVNFTAVRTPSGLNAGTTVVPHDVLVINNGIDSPRLWDPTLASDFQLSVHDPLTLPTNALTGFAYQSTFDNFLQVAGNAGKIYPTNGGAYTSFLNDAQQMYLADSQMIRMAVSGATPATPVVLTVVAHGLTTGQTVNVTDVDGVAAANGSFVITVVDSSHFSLNGTVGIGSYVGGGVVVGPGSLNVIGAVGPSGSPLSLALSVASDVAVLSQTPVTVQFDKDHLAVNGDLMFFSGIGGINGANGLFQIAVVDATHVTLIGSLASGAYTSGGNASYSRYSASMPVPLLTVTPMAAGVLSSGGGLSAAAGITFATPLTVNTQLLMVVEGQDPVGLLQRMIVAVSGDNTTFPLATNWVNVFDPFATSINNTFSAYPYEDAVPTIPPQQNIGAIYPGQNRYVIAFALTALPAGQIVKHIRLGWTEIGQQTYYDETMAILGVYGAGGYPGGTQWGLAYEDEFSRSESFGIAASAVTGCSLSSVGGPSIITAPLPAFQAINYDYSWTVPNVPATTFFPGGLSKQPTIAPIYMQLPGQSVPLYAFALRLLNPVISGGAAGWTPQNVGPTFTVSSASIAYFDQSLADPSRAMPSAFQISIPPANASVFASSRLFVGDIYNVAGGVRVGTDVYFSSASQPFRFSGVPVDSNGNYDPSAGSRVTFVAEMVMAMVASSSMAEAASYIYVASTTALHMLGGGGIMGALTDATSLGTPHRIGSLGTQSWRTMQERNGVVMWLDNEFCLRRMYGGVPADVSRKHIDNLLKAIPAPSRGLASAVWTRDRYFLSITPQGQNTNQYLAVWYEPGQFWESLDLPPVPYQRLVVLYNPNVNGTGRQLLGIGSDMNTYWHENGTTDLGSPIAIEIDSRELNAGDGQSIIFDHTTVLCDPVASTNIQIQYLYRPYASIYTTELPISTGFGTDGSASQTETNAPPDGLGQRGATARMKVTGNVPGGVNFQSIIGYYRSDTASEPSAS